MSWTAATELRGDSLEHNLVFVGTVGIIDPPREEAAVAIAEAHRAGIRVIMITGDHPRTAARIAADLRIVEPGATALTGLELDALDDAAFADVVRTTSRLRACGPCEQASHRRRATRRRERRCHDR